MRAGRIVLLIIGVVLAIGGLGLGAAGAGTMWAHVVVRDADGYLATDGIELATAGSAITAEDVELATVSGDWTGWVDELDVRLRVTPTTTEVTDPDIPVFVGIAAQEDVDRYLDGVAHDQLVDVDGRTARTEPRIGTRTPPPPATQAFWVASNEGTGTQELTWAAEPGAWAAVIMPADGSGGVAVTADVGVRTEMLGSLAGWMLTAAVFLVGIGAALIFLAFAGRGPSEPTAPAVLPAEAYAYPVTVTGHLDERVSRWQWLVKWFLLIPHVLVLAVLWLVFFVTTVAAGVAILFTGRYPRSIFDMNVGILRWTWRVTFYGYGVLGTDRYPPFSLDHDDHPASLSIVYPERLSRGLVLVKWWLLALPHLIIVAIFTGGIASWSAQVDADSSWQWSLGGGLIGVLALVAGIVLLFTARYPQGLFDLLMGLNRWVLRVTAYVALMTDEYPPFRLDMGGDEPQPAPPPPGGPPPTPVQRPPTPVKV